MKCYSVNHFRAPLEATTLPTPEPTGTQVLLRVKAAGVCHSDIHIWEGGYDLGQGRTLAFKDRGVSLPLTLGHETVGTLAAAGPHVSGLDTGHNSGLSVNRLRAMQLLQARPRKLLLPARLPGPSPTRGLC